MNKVIIFGDKDFAELAHYYLTIDSEYEVVAFAVNKSYLQNDNFKGLPLVAFEDVERNFSPQNHRFFSPMAPRDMNISREKIYQAIKKKNYDCISYISSKATIFNNNIGENCFILEDNTLQPFTDIGDNVIMWSGNHIGHHGKVDDHTFFSSHVVMSGHCHIKSYCYLGVNATIRDGLTLAEGTCLGMAATLTKETEPWKVYIGSPAKSLNKSSREIIL
jgi:sugar O-acyltransferase (sialic acid O-acetyltransferase NeuD family)